MVVWILEKIGVEVEKWTGSIVVVLFFPGFFVCLFVFVADYTENA